MVGTVIDHHGGHLVPMQLKGTQLDPCCEPSTSSKWPIVIFSSGLAWQVEEWWGRLIRYGSVLSDVFICIPCIQQSHLDLETLEYTFDMLRHQNKALTFWEVHIWIPSSSFQWSIGTNQPTNQNPLEKTEKRWNFAELMSQDLGIMWNVHPVPTGLSLLWHGGDFYRARGDGLGEF